jgi:RNA polymerase sigma-70 factor (ECF subfamily)
MSRFAPLAALCRVELIVQATNEKLAPPLFGAEAFSGTSRGAAPLPTARGSASALDGGSIDAQLVERANSGDRAAEEALYRRHVRYVAGLVARLLGDRAEAEDCIQETFAIALERLADVRDGTAVRGWIAQIAVSQVRRRFRKRKLLRAFGLDRNADTEAIEASAWRGPNPETHAELSQLWTILKSLPTEERIAWSLRHVEGSALEEVADACGCSLATAKRRIAAADAHLRARIGLEVVS